MLFVIVITQDGSRRQHTFDKASVTLGRVPEGTDMALPGSAVSARHAVLARREDGWVVADLGSTNGTWVNGRRIEGPVRIGRDDVVQVGEFTLQVWEEGGAPAAVEVGAAATMAIQMPPPASRASTGISWATAKQGAPAEGAAAGADADVGSWSTMQAPVVNEATHGPESAQVAVAMAPSTRTASVCMSCGAPFAADALFCQSCGARRGEVQAAPVPVQQPAPSIEYDATGAIPVAPSPIGYEATGAIAVVAPSIEFDATGAMPVILAPAPSAVAPSQPAGTVQAPRAPTAIASAPPTPVVPSPPRTSVPATRVMHAHEVAAPAPAQAPLPIGATAPILVDPSGVAGFPSIVDAIRMAPAGSVIRVKPGVYGGCLVIDKPLTLIADGAPVVVESAEGPCLMSYAATGLVQGFTFRGVAGNTADAAVLVSRGALRLDRCEIVSSRGAALLVEGPESEPVVSSCAVRSAGAEGVLVRGGARPRIDGTDVAGSARAGICVQDGGVPVVTRCSVHDTQAQGLLVHGESAGTFEDCDVAGCKLAGVDVLSGGRPTVRRCRIRDSREGCGVIVQYAGGGLFEDCVITGHRLSAVEVREAGQPLFRRCSLSGSQLERGLYVYDNGLGVFEDCEMARNRRHGVGVRSGAQPVLRRCRVYGSLEAGGIYLYRQGSGTFDECEISGNQTFGVEVVEASLASLRRCRVHDNVAGALRASGNRALHAVECEFVGGAARALHMDAAARARLERCSFVGECVCSVDCTCDSEGSTFRQA